MDKSDSRLEVYRKVGDSPLDSCLSAVEAGVISCSSPLPSSSGGSGRLTFAPGSTGSAAIPLPSRSSWLTATGASVLASTTSTLAVALMSPAGLLTVQT